jgi:predicted dehydrogenase
VFANGALGAVIQQKSDAAATLAGWDTMVWGTRGALKVSGGVLEATGDKEQTRVEAREDDRFLGAVREFAGAVAERRDPVPGGEDGRQALASVLALYEAAGTGRTVEVAA